MQEVGSQIPILVQDITEDVDRYKQILDRQDDNGRLAMYFLDLEVGADAEDKSDDSTILISPDGKVMLIDAGHPDAGTMVLGVLNELGIKRIDYLICFYPYIDHIGGVPEIIESIEVGLNCYTAVEYNVSETYNNMMQAIEENQIETMYLGTGDVIPFGEEIVIKVLGPDKQVEYPKDYPENSARFLNNESLLLKIVYGESNVIFGGDIY